MNEKFCILHEAAEAKCNIQNFEFIVHSASACICKQNTNLTVSNTFNRELKMRRFCPHQRRPEVNQAVVDGVSRSCLKSQTAVEKASRS